MFSLDRLPKTFSKLLTSGLAAAALAGLASVPAQAQTAEEFYAQKGLTIVVASSAGGSFDLFGRLLARNMSKYLPGNPNIVVQNMVGAGGMTAANYLYNVAEKDGSVIAVLQRNTFVQDLLEFEGVDYDATKFNYIGNPFSETSVLISNKASEITSMDSVKSDGIVLAGTAPGSDGHILVELVNEAIGSQIEIIAGYPGLQEMLLAVERAEVDGVLSSWGGIKSTRHAWIENDQINVLLQFGAAKAADLPDVPYIYDLLSEDADRQAVELMTAGLVMAYPFVAPPEVPADRVAFLQDVFLKAMADPELIEEAKVQGYDVKALSGAEMTEIVAGLAEFPEDIILRAKAAGGLI